MGIRDVESLFISTDKYYEPVLVKRSFDGNYEYCEIRGNKDKKLSAHQYLYMILSELKKLINKRKNNSNEQKVQLSMGINYKNIKKSHTFYVKSDNADITKATNTSNTYKFIFFPISKRGTNIEGR